MRYHIDALILLQRVWAAFGFILAGSLLVLTVGMEIALVRIGSLGRAERGTVWVFGICALIIAAEALGALIAAKGLDSRRTSGRTTALAMAVVNLVLVPFGTGLGVYTFWVLLNDDARREFGRPPRGSSPSASTRG